MNKLVEFFLSPDSYPKRPDEIRHIETHISHVFLAGAYAYKVKKPVKFDFLDFSTLKKRLFYCKREVLLNARLARNCYIGVFPVYIKGDRLQFKKGKGAKVFEYVVLMKRLDEAKILSTLIEAGNLLLNEIAEIGKKIAHFHKETPPFYGDYYGSLSVVKRDNEENLEEIAPFVGKTLSEAYFSQIKNYTEEFIRDHRSIFSARKASGFIKEIHGDLHTKHIVLTKPIVIFDCIEFNNRFRIDDILNDIAFLLMDLEFMGRFDLSRTLYDTYFKINSPCKNDELLNFYKVYRAVVRGKIESLTAENVSETNLKEKALKRAKDYFSLACHYISNNGKAFNPLIFMGLSGSGKSRIAKLFQDKAVILRSDEVRKRLFTPAKVKKAGINEGLYSPSMTEKTYKNLLNFALEFLKSGKKVIIDATFIKTWQRTLFMENLLKEGYNPLFLFFTAPEGLLLERIRNRKREGKDISDADEAVLQHQLQTFEPPLELPSFRLLKLSNTASLEEIKKNVEVLLQ